MEVLFIYKSNKGQIKALSTDNRFFQHEDLIKRGFTELGKLDSEQWIQDLFDKVAKDHGFGRTSIQSVLDTLISSYKDNSPNI